MTFLDFLGLGFSSLALSPWRPGCILLCAKAQISDMFNLRQLLRLRTKACYSEDLPAAQAELKACGKAENVLTPQNVQINEFKQLLNLNLFFSL